MALYGAAGALGEQIRAALEGEGLPVKPFLPAGAARSAGGEVTWRGRPVKVASGPEVDALEPDVAILAVPDEAATDRRERLMRAGTLVIDASPSGRLYEGLPLIWPSLNVEALESHEGGFAVAGDITSTVAPVAAALAGLGKIAAIDAVALLGATHAGLAGQSDLSAQTLALMNYKVPDPGVLGGELAFNVMLGSRLSTGHDNQLADPYDDVLSIEMPRLSGEFADVAFSCTTLRIPVFSGTAVTLTVRFAPGVALDAGEVLGALRARGDIDLVGVDVVLRDTLDREEVLVGPPKVDVAGGTIRLVVFADATYRVGVAIAALLDRMHNSKDLW